MTGSAQGIEVPPAGTEQLFGPAWPQAQRYAALLAEVAVARGLLGPREADRVWSRHLLNCAPLAGVLETGAVVLDLGSGAGLPGVVLALLDPSLRLLLLDATRRRTEFLTAVVADLELGDRVEVIWGRAEQVPALGVDAVVARAVAPLGTLAGWAVPHLRADGVVLALKGSTAAAELAASAADLTVEGFAGELLALPQLASADPAQVVRLTRRPAVQRRSADRPGRRTLPRSPAHAGPGKR